MIELRPGIFRRPGLLAPFAGRLPDRTAKGSWDLLCNSRLLPCPWPGLGSRRPPLPSRSNKPGPAGRAGRRARPPPPREPSPCSSVWLLYKYLNLYSGFFPSQPDFFLSFIF